MAAVLCPRCGAAVPFTGAFAFVVCPKDQTVIHVARAARAPAGAADPASPPLPAAAAFLPPELDLAPPVHIVRRVARSASIVGAGLVLFVLLSELAALLLGAPTAWAYARSTSEPFVPLLVSFPFPIAAAWIGGEAAVVWFGFLIGTIVLAAVFLSRAHLTDAWSKFLRAMEGRGMPTLDEPNAIFVVARLFSVSVFLGVAAQIIVTAIGSSPHVPASLVGEPLGAELILSAHAAVWEELVTRVLLLGLPLLLIHFAGRGRLERPTRRYLIGGGFTLEGPALALIVFQAAIFASAHVPGWGLWRFPDVFLGGLALGFLFLRYGLFASILVHFLIDFRQPTLDLAASTGFPLLLSIALHLLLLVGAVHAIRYVFVLGEIVKAGKIPEYMGGPATLPRPPAPAVSFVPGVATAATPGRVDSTPKEPTAPPPSAPP